MKNRTQSGDQPHSAECPLDAPNASAIDNAEQRRRSALLVVIVQAARDTPHEEAETDRPDETKTESTHRNVAGSRTVVKHVEQSEVCVHPGCPADEGSDHRDCPATRHTSSWPPQMLTPTTPITGISTDLARTAE
jgi:hypothetical protein